MVVRTLSSTVHWRIQPFVKRNIKSLPTDFAEGWRQAILGKDQRARIVHRSMRVELGRVGKACPIEDQAVQLGLFCHPNERNVGKFSSDVAATDIRMSSREPDLLDDLRSLAGVPVQSVGTNSFRCSSTASAWQPCFTILQGPVS